MRFFESFLGLFGLIKRVFKFIDVNISCVFKIGIV